MISDLIQAVDCLNESQLDEVLSYVDSLPWESTTVFGEDGPVVNNDIRSNARCCLHDDSPMAKIMHLAVNEALLEYNEQLSYIHPEFAKFPVPGAYMTQCHREQFQVLRYNETEHYSWHHDQASDRRFNEHNRTISVVLYLKNADKGGKTISHIEDISQKQGKL